MTDKSNFSLTFTVEQLTALVAEAISEGRRASRTDPDELAVIVIRALIAKV